MCVIRRSYEQKNKQTSWYWYKTVFRHLLYVKRNSRSECLFYTFVESVRLYGLYGATNQMITDHICLRNILKISWPKIISNEKTLGEGEATGSLFIAYKLYFLHSLLGRVMLPRLLRPRGAVKKHSNMIKKDGRSVRLFLHVGSFSSRSFNQISFSCALRAANLHSKYQTLKENRTAEIFTDSRSFLSTEKFFSRTRHRLKRSSDINQAWH